MEENQSKSSTSTEKLPTEIMTTSTAESESFDSWTLVSDAKKTAVVASQANENEPSGVELLVADESKNHENDDLSDGISIISECESAGRLSPLQPQNHELNGDENHNQTNNNNNQSSLSYEPLTPPNTPDSWKDQSSQTRISRYAELISASSSAAIIDEQHGTDDDYDDDDDDDKIPIPMNSITPTTALTTKIGLFIRLPMSKLFILSTTIALIAFFGNLKYFSLHEPTTTNLPHLHERLVTLELQNNLLRAEIDILSKNLNSINRNQQQNRVGEKFIKKHDKDKVWKNKNGRGDYREYKEPIVVVQSSERVVNEFDNESNLPPTPPPPPPSPPQEQQEIPSQQNQQQQSGLPTYCKDGENLWCSQDPSIAENPTVGATEDNLEQLESVIDGGDGEKQIPDGLNEKNHSERREKNEKDSFKKDDYKKKFKNNGKERNDSKENNENRKFDKRHEDDYKKYDNNKEKYKNYNHKYENKKFDEKRDKKRGGKVGDDSKEKYDKKRQNNEKKKFNDSDYDDDDDDDDDDYDSHEHYSHHHDFKTQDKRYVDKSDNSRERQQRNDSKEHYEKRKNFQKYGKNQKHKKDNDYSDDDDQHHHNQHPRQLNNNQSDHDDWHEKMMQHREIIRMKKNHKNDNNWYLERGTGREEARVFEKKEKHASLSS